MASPTDPADTAPTRTIVVIDDVADLVESVVMVLELEGYEAFGETRGSSGIRKAEEAGADLVLLDYAMPEMDGAEIGAALRAHPALARVKILMMSATPEPMVQRAFRDYDGFLAKPVLAEDLLAAIDGLIGRSALPAPQTP